MDGSGSGRDAAAEISEERPSRATGIRHLVLGFVVMVAILFTAALCSLPR